MANLFVDHRDRWLSLAESDSDYPILFIRTWIPFNAWYCNTYPGLNNKDRLILDALKSDNNLFRTRIIALLNGDDAEAINFKNSLAQLHYSLERYYVPSVEKRISFTSLYFRDNPNLTDFKRARKFDYKAEVMRSGTNVTVKADIIETATGAYKYRYPNNPYKVDQFLVHLNATANLTDEQRVYIKACFDNVDPKKKESLIQHSKRNALIIGDLLFINNTDLISKAVIELLYNLRCILFHGELPPSRDNLSIYEHAYILLRILIKSLR